MPFLFKLNLEFSSKLALSLFFVTSPVKKTAIIVFVSVGQLARFRRRSFHELKLID